MNKDLIRESFVKVFEEKFKNDVENQLNIMVDIDIDPDILDIINLLKSIYDYRGFLKFKENEDRK